MAHKAVGMIILIASLLSSAAHSNAVSHKYHRHILDNIATGKARQPRTPSAFAVLGVDSVGSDAIHPRLEIRELERNRDQFNVFLLGLQRFQNIDQEDKFSYFQVAGIHGRPFIPWDGVEKHPKGKQGYCRHSSNIFPTWHRPYLALVEELVYHNAREVISEFPEGDLNIRMSKALRTLRLPYWDAAAVPPIGEGTYPWVVQRKTIEVEVPNGNSSTTIIIPNPLYTYTFHPLPVEAFRSIPANTSSSLQKAEIMRTANGDPWIQWRSTKRFPTNNNANAESQDNKIALQLDANNENLRQRTYQMLAMQKDYYNISNNMVHNKDPLHGVVLDSLESVHDTLHNTIGGGSGHMWQLQYSAFDPIFWLLHANTDRMLAIWQGLNPTRYVTNHSNPLATFTTPPKSWADENTPLHPFHRNNSGDFWTSATVRDPTIFIYTYPSLINLSYHVTLVHRVNSLYSQNATSQFSWDLEKVPEPAPEGESQSATAIPSGGYGTSGPMHHLHGQSGQELEYHYFVNIRARKGGSASAYKVLVFFDDEVGRTTPNSRAWIDDPGFVGFTGFPSTAMSGEETKNGVIALTIALEERVTRGALSSLDETNVAAYLQERMTCRVVVGDNQVLPPEEEPNLELEVAWAKFEPSTPNTFPEVQNGGFRHLMRSTNGKAGDV